MISFRFILHLRKEAYIRAISPFPFSKYPEQAMADYDTEKASSPRDELAIDLDEIGETKGYIVDVSLIEDKALVEHLKLAPDGHTILIPQPSDDPNDPLNWSWRKKHLFLIIISMCAWLPDYAGATGSIAVLPQSKCASYFLVHLLC